MKRAAAVLVVLVLLAAWSLSHRGGVRAHGTADQSLVPLPGCTDPTGAPDPPPLPRADESTSSLLTMRQEFKPIYDQMSGLDLCITAPGPGNAIVRVTIRQGTVASPGAVVSPVVDVQVNAGQTYYVHFELPADIDLIPNEPYLIEVTKGSPVLDFEWRGMCAQVMEDCTSVDAERYPNGVSNGSEVQDFAFKTYAPNDTDGDGDFDGKDNCINDYNPGQENADADYIELTPYGITAYDDLTWPHSDAQGDACDVDDDQDDLFDADELALGPGHPLCTQATGPTDPLLRDSDGDRVLDGAECAMGSIPTNPGSFPPIPTPFGQNDTDGDQLTNSFEGTIGTTVNDADTDDDGVIDGVEYKYYNSLPLIQNTDGDLCKDAREIASVSDPAGPALQVNSTDLSQIAQRFSPAGAPPYIVPFDVNKDNKINSTDLSFVAQRFGLCP